MRFQTVMFDLDGTLVDHLPAIHRCYAHTLPLLGLPAPTREEVRHAIGGGLEDAMRRFVDEAGLPRALALYRAYWDQTMLDGVELMPGVRDLLNTLHETGVSLAVLTNKHGPSSRRICKHLGIDRLLRGVFGAQDTPWLKPDPRFTDYALATLHASPATACLVGDSPFDVETARRGGIEGFFLTTGAHSAGELHAAGAGQVFPGLAELGREGFALMPEEGVPQPPGPAPRDGPDGPVLSKGAE
jgi:phosphoglycolate phosphatase